ncbi:MAG: DNA-directed RNA polymerase subunit omega [Candidatus Omnitrophica bacterium]|nr:DNA-directed RNA polymerase subunit omega [Candidatus Omnitrophota bacterium]MDD5670981.1 DNA-directed RNA polymerase subunit omega [Candidatus Omnitrophota bacterium]
MAYIPLEKLMKVKNGSLFKLVIAAAARANELIQGASPLVQSHAKKLSVTALEEIASGKVRYEEIKPKTKNLPV